MRQYFPQGNLLLVAVSSQTNFKLDYIYQTMISKFEPLVKTKEKQKGKTNTKEGSKEAFLLSRSSMYTDIF